LRLDEEFGILGRVGLHCAPAAHRTIGTFPEGTVRLALGLQTTEDDITSVIEALKKILLRCHA
jgi:selenocysteine lyase/cysteine desulfurase